MSVTWLHLCLGAGAIYLLNRLHMGTKYPGPLPAGPRPWPLIGNLLDMPTTREWVKYAEMGRKYGGSAWVTVFGQNIMLISDGDLAIEMLDKKSAKYSCRPVLQMGGELSGWRETLVLVQYGQKFKEYRRYVNQLIGSKKSIGKFFPVEEYETARFLQRVAAKPEALSDHVRRTAGAIILRITYGYELQDNNGRDPLVDHADKTVSQFSASTLPGAWLVDVLPILRHVPEWIPGANFKKLAREWKASLQELADRPYNFTKQQMAKGVAPPSFVSYLLENEASATADELHNMKWAAGSLYSGGADTTVSAIYSLYLAMVLFPEVQKKAQAEIDAVVGNDRLPSFSDRSALPYCEAVLKEVFRWNVVVPLAVPHRSTEEDWQDSKYIPANTLIIPNVWWMLRDPERYPNPEIFDPERYIPAPGKTAQTDPRTFAFGFGRRICPGLNLADASVFISLVMSLAVFDIKKVIENGVEITPEVDIVPGTITHPNPYKCDIRPRSAKAAALIEQEPTL
ncbi:cytochrome P450 [Athelia psychrophila]|uniref:Cytochrome P450 n=1 Tax=Athelia psychrophila TaxID=1759441 RepID=A0A166JLU6_9AGAM|nr:cytochrome P450 [Fibularhizoctonia sp. CBS 109695]